MREGRLVGKGAFAGAGRCGGGAFADGICDAIYPVCWLGKHTKVLLCAPSNFLGNLLPVCV